jgi:hypothetical protein
MSRDFKVKIETEEEFFADLIAQAEKIDRGVIPDKPIERISLPDLETFYRYCTPNRVMKKDWNSHIWAKNPIGVTPAKAGVQCFVL